MEFNGPTSQHFPYFAVLTVEGHFGSNSYSQHVEYMSAYRSDRRCKFC